MAYIVGTLLIILVPIGLPLQWWAPQGSNAQDLGIWITHWVGVAHGFLYMVFLVTAAMLAVNARFTVRFTLLVLISGIVPVLSFYAERMASRRVYATHPAEFGLVARAPDPS
jgi:integral membrane protein